MKILKPEHPVERAVQEIEHVLEKYGLLLTATQLYFSDVDDKRYCIYDTAYHRQETMLPRILESERVAIRE